MHIPLALGCIALLHKFQVSTCSIVGEKFPSRSAAGTPGLLSFQGFLLFLLHSSCCSVLFLVAATLVMGGLMDFSDADKCNSKFQFQTPYFNPSSG